LWVVEIELAKCVITCLFYVFNSQLFELFESKKHINLQGPWRTGCNLH